MRKGQDAHSLGGSTGYVFRSPKSKVGGAGQEDVFLDDEELLSCSSRLPSMTDSILMSLTNVAGMEWTSSPILCCLFSSSSTSSLDAEHDMVAKLESRRV